MSGHLLAIVAIISAVLATLGSLFLAYDYLEDPSDPQSHERNPLRALLRFAVPIFVGSLPGLILYPLISLFRISDVGSLNVFALITVMGTAIGFLSAWFISDGADGANIDVVAIHVSSQHHSMDATRFLMAIGLRAALGLCLGLGAGISVATFLHTSADNALTLAGNTGPILMVFLAVWPLISWTPILGEIDKYPDIPRDRTTLTIWLLGIAGVSFWAGIVDGLFDARGPQRLYACTAEQHACATLLTASAWAGVAGTAVLHAVLFVLGGTLAGLIWLLWERALPLLWNEVLAHSAFAARVNGLALGGVAGGLAFYSLSLFGSTFLRVTHATAWLYIPPLLALVVGGIAGFFLPFRPVEKTWREPHPFSRYDAIMTASFVLCVLLSYTTLTNLGDYLSMALGLPHAFEGSSTVIPVQFSRIAYYSQPIVLIGLPAALAIGGLTRAAYRWALTVPHRRLGAIGIGLTLLAFTLQLIGPMSVLVS